MKQSRGKPSALHPKSAQHLYRDDRHPPKDEVFFVQNAGSPAAGTGLHKSSIIQKISLADAEAVRNGSLHSVPITVVNTSNPQIINPNGMYRNPDKRVSMDHD